MSLSSAAVGLDFRRSLKVWYRRPWNAYVPVSNARGEPRGNCSCQMYNKSKCEWWKCE
jgi:hypothetical protein